MGDRLIAVVRKNEREFIHISLSEYRGYRLINQRVWYQATNGQARPGRAGLAVRVDALDEMIAALVRARSEAAVLGWLEPAIRVVPAAANREVGP